jgi:transposase InsO family protein
MLELIHEGHLGLNKCLRRAKNIMFWPGMTGQIKQVCDNCQICALFRKNNSKEPIQFHDVPKFPWLKLGSDIFELNRQYYLIVVDYYSKFFEVVQLNNLSSRTIINHIKSMIARHGYPLEIVSDNGPQYSSKEFKEFADTYGFKHTTSSPNYPKSNGLAESTVKIVKSLLKKCKQDNTDPHVALLNFRNSPKENSPSPANLLFNRNLNERCPVSANYLKPKIYTRNSMLDKKMQEKVKYHYNKTAKPLNELEVGQDILFKKKISDECWKKGIIVDKDKSPRSYIVEDECGHQYRRNRQHLCISRQQLLNSVDYSNDVDEFGECESFYDAEQDDIQNSSSSHTIETPHNSLYTTRSGRTVKPPLRLIESC